MPRRAERGRVGCCPRGRSRRLRARAPPARGRCGRHLRDCRVSVTPRICDRKPRAFSHLASRPVRARCPQRRSAGTRGAKPDPVTGRQDPSGPVEERRTVPGSVWAQGHPSARDGCRVSCSVPRELRCSRSCSTRPWACSRGLGSPRYEKLSAAQSPVFLAASRHLRCLLCSVWESRGRRSLRDPSRSRRRAPVAAGGLVVQRAIAASDQGAE